MDRTDFDFAIVGAGIAGASLAWRLSIAGRRVVLLERESQPGYHASGRSAAMFMESYGPPAVRALTRASRAFYETPPAGFCETPLLGERGALYVAAADQQALLERTAAELAPSCPRLAALTEAQALRRVPCLRPPLAGALYDPDARDIDVHALHQAWLRGLRAGGGVLLVDAELVAAAAGADGRWQVGLRDGRSLQATTLVNAAGAWADAVASIAGARPLGVVPHRRSAFTFDAPAGTDAASWPTVIGIDESWYFKPDAGRLLGSPANADATVAHDVRPEELDIALGIDRIEQATTLTIRRPHATWAGLRSFVRDGEPVIGWDGERRGFFWLAAQGGYGIQSAAGASALAASLLQGEPLPPQLRAAGVDARALAPQRLG